MPHPDPPKGRRTVGRALPLAGVLVVCLAVTVAFTAGATTNSSAPGDAPDERTNATHLDAGETIEANLSSGEDVDWYAVNATAGDAIVATVGLPNGTENQSVRVDLYDPSGTLITEAPEAEKDDGPRNVAGRRPIPAGWSATGVAPDVAEVNGTYYVKVNESEFNRTAENVSTPYNLTVTTEPLDRHDPNEHHSTATPIELEQVVEGVVVAFDYEHYAVNLTKGQNYTVTFNLTNTSDDTSYSKSIQVVNNPMDSDSMDTVRYTRTRENATLTFTAQDDGRHHLEIGPSGSTYQILNRDTYRLTIRPTDGGDDGDTGSDNGDDDGGDTPTDETSDETDETTPTATSPPGDGATPTCTPTTAEGDTMSPCPTDTTTDTTDGDSEDADGNGTDADKVETTGTASQGPGFGLAVTLISMVAIALLAVRRNP